MRAIYNTKGEKEQLTEIKAGKTGYGLLIEHDGHIIGKKDTIQQIKEDIDNGHKFVIPDDFIVSAVFQKYGIKNANGNIWKIKWQTTQQFPLWTIRVIQHCLDMMLHIGYLICVGKEEHLLVR